VKEAGGWKMADRFQYLHPIFVHGLFITLMMEAVCTSEMLVYFNETT
jgi:hypothetical protein